MIVSPRMDDEIIYSWCFNDVECFDSTPSVAIIILDKDLESFSSLSSQQKLGKMVDYERYFHIVSTESRIIEIDLDFVKKLKIEVGRNF